MGMTWSEYKAYREKKKKEEEQTKKQQKASSSKTEKTITNNANNQEKNNNLINTISQNNRLPLNNENANKIALNTTSLQDIVSKNNSSKIVQTNNNPLAKQIEEQNANKPLQKAIEEQKKKPKTTQKEPSTWERIMDNFRIGGYGGITGVAQTGYRDIRDIDNMYTDASSSLRHQVLSTFFGEHGENFARAVDDKLYKWNNDRNQVYNYALDVLNKEQQTNKQNIQQNIEAVKQSGDKVGTKFAELAPSVGNNAMGLLAGTVNPALAFTYYKGSSEASYYDDALQRGMTEDQAKVYSKLMSYVEAGTETISVGNILKGGKAIKAVASGAKNIGVKEGLKAGFNVFKESAKEETANALKQGLKSYGIGIAEEFFQEAITEPIQEFTAMKVAGEDKADWNNMWQRMLQSGVDGALSSAILAGANMGISSCQGIVTKVQNGQEFTTEEYNTAIKDASEKVDVGKMTTDGIKNQVEKLKTEMQQSQNEVNKDINPKNKMPQNQFSQAEKTETLRQEARNKLESIKQNYDENSYNQMQEFIETAPSEKALNQVISDLNKEAETKQVAPLKQKQEVQLPLKQETQNKSFEDVVFDAMNNYESNEVESPLKNRDMDSIGKQTKVNAYQYDNPKVKPYFQEMAQQMGEDLAYISSSDNRSTQKGGGTKLSTTTKAMDILHNEQGYSYDQIAKGLQNIIDDKGSENNAISKKIELVIDEQLRNGYTNALGKNIEPNQEYINTITEQYSLAEQPQQNNFKYEQSDNSKIDTFRQDASKYWDNSEKTSKLVNTIEKIINDKGYNIRLDDTLGDNVNGRIVTNNQTGETEITINPNSNRKGEFIIGHELTHAIETQEMVDLVKKRMEKDEELRNAVEDLKKLYGTDDINGEVLADISGQLFGNQEFINNLSVEKPSVFKRIYDKIVSLANKITGNSSEALFLKDLKNKWEKAYRENTNNIKEEQYSKNITVLPKVKEGYTRLYRGLESEYNSQYDKNKLDNVNGYESWTDDYDLAKSYGNNVYYIDIPTSEIKNSIIDEDSTSETYGDRNLIYKNDKPVGINGKNGNEYMLYTEHDNYKNIKYNKTNNQATVQDNQGNKLNPNMQKFMRESKAKVNNEGKISEDGNLAVVYHTTTDKVAQFNEFNPVGTPYYRFGDQVVNYYTDSKDMSGSYSNNRYKMADTKKLNNINEANDYLKGLNDSSWNDNKYYIENKGNSYYLKENSLIGQEALDFLNGLSSNEIKQLRDNIFVNEEFKNTPYGKAFSWNEFDKGLQEKYHNLTNKYLGSDNLIDIQKRMIEYLENPESYNKDKDSYINKYDNEEQLLRNLKQDIQKKDWTNNSNIQYEGYVNITNPYIIDAEGKNWDSVVSKLNKDIEKNISEIKSDTKKVTDLINLQLESEKKYNQYNQNNLHEEYLLQARLVKDLERGLPLDVRNDIEDTYLFGFNFDDYATKTTKNKVEGKNLVKDLLTKYAEEHDANDIREFNTKIEKYGNLTLNEFLKQAHEAYNTDMKYGKEDAYFKSEVEKILNRDITKAFNDDFITGEQLYKLAKEGFSKNAVLDILGERQTTNDIVNQVIEMNKNGSNYDGIIMKNVLDYGGNSQTREPANLYVTFNSNQFKAIDNENPTSDPDIRYSKQNQSWQDYLESNYKSEGTTTDLRDIRLPMKEKQEVKLPMKGNVQQSQENTKVKFDNEVMKTNSEIKGNSETSEKVAKILSEPTKNVKPEQRTWAILKANFIDKGAVFEKLSQKTKNRDLQGKYDYTLSSGARGQYAIGNDRYTYSNGKKTLQSKSLTSIIDEVGENTQAFNEYMYHQLNVDRMTLDERFGIDNKPVFGESITADKSRAEIAKIEEQHPEFKKYAEDVYQYLDANKQELVDKGVISQETSDMFKERYPHYVPIQRITNKGNSINVPLDTGRTGINTPIKKAKGGNQDINPLFQTMASQTLQTYRASARNNFGLELKNTLQQINQLSENNTIADIDEIVDTMTNEEQNNELLQKGKKGENPTFTVFDNGQKVTYEISQDMYDALKPKSELLNKWDNTKFAKAGRKISNFRRGVLTEYNPIFSITNAIKDAQDVLVNSQHAGKTYAKFPEAYAQILKKGYWYNEYIQNGGEQSSYFTEGDFENIHEKNKAKNILTFPLQKISDVNNVIEMAPRLAEYIVSRQNGANIETAMLDASRVTTNFKAGGDITKFANRNGATFLNASFQGFQQQVRNIQEANMKGLKGWTNLALKYTVAGLPALLLNNLFWDDDDDYEQLQDYVKDNYYVVAKLPNGNFLRIPKGRMVATIQKVVSNANDFVKDGKINSDDVASTIWNDLKEDVSFGMDNLAPNNPIDNNILSPIIQVAQNKTWYGDDLVPQRLQDVPDAEQADESTDKLSRWLGEKLGKSPKKINYLLDQYSGGIGDVLLPLGTPQAENNVIEDKFTTDPVMKSQYPSDFFSKVDELNVKHNSIKATDEDILKYKYISSVQQEVSSLYKQKREIQASDKSDATKKQELKEVQKQINKLAKDSLENVDNVKISGESATIGDKQYYKNKGTWTKLTDKEKEKLNGTSTSIYSDYKNATNNLSDKEKIQTLRDSNYSKSDKSNLYEKTISTDKYYPTLKKSGIDIDEYMDYKLAQSNGDFTADKKNGKTVMGSGKKKVIKYLNNNITGYGNRLLIAGKQYSLSASQRKDLSNYINKTFTTQKERTEVYKQLKLNFVVNGNKVTYK